MKIDLSRLSIPDQVVAVMRVIAQRRDSGAKVTHSSDLLRYFKHRAFPTQKQRLAHYVELHRLASAALTGRDVDREMSELAQRVIWEVGDEANYGGSLVRIVDLPEDDKATVRFDGSVITVSRSELKPVLHPPGGK